MVPPSRILPRALLFVVVGCSADPGHEPGGSATIPPLASASSAPVGPRDPAWEVARASGDPLDIAALGRIVDAPRLLADIDDATFGEVARLALVEARDRELALGPLAARVRAGGKTAERDAELILAIVSRAPAFGESLDIDAIDAAVSDLDAVARDAARDARTRAVCISVLRRLAEAGAPVKALPSDLDAP